MEAAPPKLLMPTFFAPEPAPADLLDLGESFPLLRKDGDSSFTSSFAFLYSSMYC
jgi:hypothetical protein